MKIQFYPTGFNNFLQILFGIAECGMSRNVDDKFK
jgi:hypothetical protein